MEVESNSVDSKVLDIEMEELSPPPQQATGPEPSSVQDNSDELTCQLDKGKAVFSLKDGSLKFKTAKSELQLRAGTVGSLMRNLPAAQSALVRFDSTAKSGDGTIWSKLLSANARQKQSLEVRAFKDKAYLFVCCVFRAQAVAQAEEAEVSDPRLLAFLQAEKEFKDNGYWYQNAPFQLTSDDIDALYPFVTEGLVAMRMAQK